MKRKIAIIAALFCIGCIVAEPATDIKAAGIQVAAAQTTLSADNSLEVYRKDSTIYSYRTK